MSPDVVEKEVMETVPVAPHAFPAPSRSAAHKTNKCLVCFIILLLLNVFYVNKINYIYVVNSKILNDMKKSIFSALCLVLLATTTQSAWGEGCADFSTLQENTSYGKRTTTAGWISTYSAVESFDSATGVKLNGKTSAQGVLSSPTLANGCGTLTFSYGSANDTKIGFTISIKDASDVEVYNSGSDYASLTITKNTVYTFSKAINCSGNFTITISNASPSNSTKNANRLNISKLCWTSYSGTTPTTVYLGLFLAAFVAVRACVRRVECLYATFHHIIMSKIDFRSVHFAKALFVSFLGFVLFLSIKCRFLSFFLANMCKSASLRWCAQTLHTTYCRIAETPCQSHFAAFWRWRIKGIVRCCIVRLF